ncbi:MAG: hypothetical protein OIN66_13395 [Candidatus Methanoperedens sp.]|nr:hypothetical protein [Candidatus Methanoperedens sp.]
MRLILKALLLIVYNITFQRVLYLTAFLTFGIGDGVTAAYMMEVNGPYSESNPIIRGMFIMLGFEGMIIAKLWVTLMMLLATYIVQARSKDNIYWTINGFLFAQIAAGAMGIYANLSALIGGTHPEAGDIVLLYFVFVLVLTRVGDFIDKHVVYKA